MKFDLDTAWRDTRQYAGNNSGLLSAIAGIFVFLPYALLLLSLPLVADMPEVPEGASFEAAMDAMNAFYAQTWWAFALIALIVTVGQLAMLALLGRRASPTVGEAIGIGGKALLPAWLALILQSLAINFVVLLIITISSLTGMGALVGVATLFALGLAFYLFVRLSLVLPIIAVDAEMNPLRALSGSWKLTRGNGGRLAGFYLLLAIGAGVLLIVVMLIVGLLLSLGGPNFEEVGMAFLSSAIVAGLVILSTAVLAAVHRQFRRLERSGPGA